MHGSVKQSVFGRTAISQPLRLGRFPSCLAGLQKYGGCLISDKRLLLCAAIHGLFIEDKNSGRVRRRQNYLIQTLEDSDKGQASGILYLPERSYLSVQEEASVVEEDAG